MLLAGLVATEWGGDRVGLSPANRRTASHGLAGVGGLPLVGFVLLDYANFTSVEVESVEVGWSG